MWYEKLVTLTEPLSSLWDKTSTVNYWTNPTLVVGRMQIVILSILLYSWRFSRYSTRIYSLVHCHMISNNKTVSRQMPWLGNIAKTMTSNRKQFTVIREMLTAVARHLSITWLFVFHRFDPFALLYNKLLNDLSRPRLRVGKHWDSRETRLTVLLGTSH